MVKNNTTDCPYLSFAQEFIERSESFGAGLPHVGIRLVQGHLQGGDVALQNLNIEIIVYLHRLSNNWVIGIVQFFRSIY